MQPLGYYGLKLQTEPYFDQLTIDQLVALMSISADEIYDLYHEIRDLSVPTAILNEEQILSVPQKLALIRATCDRIELKLMQAAK
jgi:hypothetical protein